MAQRSPHPRVLKPTHTAIAAAKAIDGKDTWYSILSHRGLWLRVLPSGRKVWVLRSTAAGDKLKSTIGWFPSMDFSSAVSACAALRSNANGKNPIAAKRDRDYEKSLEEESRNRNEELRRTVAHIADRYLGKYVSEKRRAGGEKKKSAAEDIRLFNKHIRPVLGSTALDDLRTRDVAALRDSIQAPSEQRKTLAVLKALLSQAKSDGLVETNSALGIRTPQPGSRNRVLNSAEIKMLWNASTDQISGVRPSMLAAMRVQLLTAQRVGEVLSMRWADLDLDRRTWTIPASVAKNGRESLVPLSESAMDIVFSQPRNGEYVFEGHRTKKPSTSSFAQVVCRVRTALGFQHFTSHDLRRTASTRMAELQVLPHVLEAILNHSSGLISGVAAIYNRYAYETEKRDALELWAGQVERIAAA